jgi:hypothetical protein
MAAPSGSSAAGGNEESWLDSLPRRSLFAHLRDKGSRIAGGNVMCTIKENLFVWSQEELALLTMNLKRLCASPSEDIFQVCFEGLESHILVIECLPKWPLQAPQSL